MRLVACPAHASQGVAQHGVLVDQPPQHCGLAVLVQPARLRQHSNRRTHLRRCLRHPATPARADFRRSVVQPQTEPELARLVGGRDDKVGELELGGELHRDGDEQRAEALLPPALLHAEQRHLEYRLGLMRKAHERRHAASLAQQQDASRGAVFPSQLDQVLVTAREGRLEHPLGRLDGCTGALDSKCQLAIGAIDGVFAALPAIQRRGVRLRRFAAGAAWL